MSSRNRKILFYIWLPVVVLTTASFLKAGEFALWREFFVTVAQLVVTGICLSYFFLNKEGEKR